MANIMKKRDYICGEFFYENMLTCYRVYGDTESPLTPLIIIHGGPSGGFDYLLNYHELSKDGRMVIFYDQFGCGRSTHFPYAEKDFWTISLYIKQLQQVISHLGIGNKYSILGHSWGGMLAAEFACCCPSGLVGTVFASTPANIMTWRDESERLFRDIFSVSDEYIAEEIMQAKIYQQPPEKLMKYYARHVYMLADEKEHIQRSNAQFNADPTAYHAMWGANEIAVTAALSEWNITGELKNISCPCLVLHGEFDQATLLVVQPFIDEISHSHIVTVPRSSHNPHEENKIPCLAAVYDFLRGLD